MTEQEFVIERCLHTQEKRQAICLCGNAFPEPVHARQGFEEYFQKIDQLACFLVAKKADAIHGFSVFYMNDFDSKTAFLSMIAVAPSMQEKNAGSLLLSASEKLARDQGMECMALKVHHKNLQGIRFYQKHGYTIAEKEGNNDFLTASKKWGEKIQDG